MNTDSVTVDLRRYEAEQERNEQVYTAHEEAAKEDLLDKLFEDNESLSGPSVDLTIDLLLDDLAAAMGTEWQSFRQALSKRDSAELGRIILQAADNVAEKYTESEGGQEWIQDRVWEIEND